MATSYNKYSDTMMGMLLKGQVGKAISDMTLPLSVHALANIPPPLPPEIKYLGDSQATLNRSVEEMPPRFHPNQLNPDDLLAYTVRIEKLTGDRAAQITVKGGLELFLHELRRGKGSRPRKNHAHTSSHTNTSKITSVATASDLSPASSSSSTSSGSRDSAISNSTKERDGRRCILTRSTIKNSGAHIIPIHLGRDATAATEGAKVPWWDLIKIYCGDEYYGWLKGFLLEPMGNNSRSINRMENMISLEPNIHGLFDDGIISFEPIFPISANATSYKIRLHFNTRHKKSTLASIKLTDGLEFLAVEEDETFEGKWIHREVAKGKLEQICDGYIFEVSTDDIIDKPLPSPDLLLLHHHLSVICRCCGMGDIEEEMFDDEDEDEIEVDAYQANGKTLAYKTQNKYWTCSKGSFQPMGRRV